MAKYKKGSYIVIPNKEILRGKKAAFQSVYFWICEHANDNGTCYPGKARLAHEAGVDIKTVNKYLKEMVTLGLLTVTNRFKKNTKEKDTNLYQIMVVEEKEVPPKTDAPTSENGGTPTSENGAVTQSNITQSNNYSGVPPQDVAEVIDSFKNINPAHKRWFGHKTHRTASADLIEIMGSKEKVVHFVQRVLPAINSKKYAPKSTTPTELLNNLAKIKVFVEQDNNKKIGIIL